MVFLATKVPPLAVGRFTFHTTGNETSATTSLAAPVTIEGLTLSNEQISVTLNEQTGAIAKLVWNDHDYVLTGDAKEPQVNDYFYVAGRKPDHPQRAGSPEITVRDHGPLVASVSISSDGAGLQLTAT